jgi:hypothetical protein
MAKAAKKSSSGGKISLAPRTKKRTSSRSPLSLDERYTGGEPSWEGADSWSYSNFRTTFLKACYYYNYFNSGKDLIPNIVKWMQANEYSKQDIRALKAAPDNIITTTVGSVATMLLNGMPSAHPEGEEDHAEWLKNKVKALIDIGQEKLANQPNSDIVSNIVQMSVHDRVREATSAFIHKLDDWLEGFIKDPNTFDPKQINVIDYFKANDVNQAHARIIRAYYAPQREEIALAISPPKKLPHISQQIIEGYSCYTKEQLKLKLAALDEIIAATDMSVQQAKVNRKPRVKQSLSKEKLVSKIKYKATDDKLKLVSIKPDECLQKIELWVYNTKTRKLGVYVAKDTASLSIKGSSIINFNETKSVSKTVRKPEEFFKGFTSLPKTKMKKTYEEIKGVETKLNGRVNSEVIFLKAFA